MGTAGGALAAVRRAWLRVFPRYMRMCDMPVGAVFRFAPERGVAEWVLLWSGMAADELIDLDVRLRQANDLSGGLGRVLDMKVDALRGVWRVG